MLTLNNLTPSGKNRKRVGRGGSRGGTSGKGNKGQKARSGAPIASYFEGGQMTLIRKTPKRGFHNTRFQESIAIINSRDLNRFEKGATVNRVALLEKGILKGSFDKIKVLAYGDLKTEGLIVEAHYFSQAAVKKIQEKGGKIVECKE